MTRSSIGKRLALVGFLLVMVIAVATEFIVSMQRDAAFDAFRIATTNLANGMAQLTASDLGSVDRSLTELQAALASPPSELAPGSASGLRRPSAHDVLLEHARRLTNGAVIEVFGPGGEMLQTSATAQEPTQQAAMNVSGRDFFQYLGTTDDRGLFVGKPFVHPVSGRWTVPMARRIDDHAGAFAGVVVAALAVADLQTFYKVAMPAARSVFLLRRDGVLLADYPPHDPVAGQQMPPMQLPSASPFYTVIEHGGGAFHAETFLGETRVTAIARPLRGLPLVVVATVEDVNVLADFYRQRTRIILGGIAAVIGTIALLHLFGAQYQRLESSRGSLAAKNAELDTAHRQLNAILASLVQGVCLYDVNQNVVFANWRCSELYGLPAGSVRPGMSLRTVAELRLAAGALPHTSVDDYMKDIEDVFRNGWSADRIVELGDGRILLTHMEPIAGRGWIVTHEDITERRKSEEKIMFLARHDVLTGLANRTMFHERLEQAMAMARRGTAFAVFCLNLDRFKTVNDTHGQPVGDSLLRAVAARLQAVLRETDTLARLGGDEFAILHHSIIATTDITKLAGRIVETMEQPFELDEHQITVGISIGIACSPADSLDPIQLMKCADLALDNAKLEGRGGWRFFEPTMDAVASARCNLERDLRAALPLGQLELHFQPLFRSRDRSLGGFEALVRWRHPIRGLVPPGDFIPVAEDTGLIVEMGAWILRQACVEAATWPGDIRVAVNLSTRQFNGPGLVESVSAALQAARLPPARLELEITETVPLLNDKMTLSALHDLHDLGVRIALDDFGTGYSSLSYLRSFPFDSIKIDRSFVSDLEVREECAAIVRGIINLASNLRVKVTAEGIETQEQFDFLVALGCTDLQGYLLGKPMPAGDVPSFIERASQQQDRAKTMMLVAD